jgi:hypothetical protein
MKLITHLRKALDVLGITGIKGVKGTLKFTSVEGWEHFKKVFKPRVQLIKSVRVGGRYAYEMGVIKIEGITFNIEGPGVWDNKRR